MSQRTEILWSRACRVCRNVDITNEMSTKLEGDWLHLYEFCFQIIVSSDNTPKKICIECAKKIKEFSDLKNIALMSDKFWRSACLSSVPNTEVKQEITYNKEKFKNINCKIDNSETEFGSNEIFDNYNDIVDYDNLTNDIEFKNEDTECPKIQIKKKSKVSRSTKNGNGHCQSRKNIAQISNQLPEAPNLTCGICEVVLQDVSKMNQHLNEHSTNDLKCGLCKFVGRDFADLVTHRYDHFPKEYRIHLKCHVCDKKYLAKLALQFHYRSVHLNKKGGICSHCGKQFGTYTMWRDHEKLHITERYKCDLCGRKFLFRHALKTHMINHSDVKGYVCDICGKGFKRNSNLKLHLQTAHDSNKVTCDHCNGTFKNQKSLKAHLQRLNKEKTFQCEVCSKYFDTSNMLKRHMVWHSDERPYVCNVCGHSYKSTSQLNIHMRKHTGVMPFKCDQCTKCYPTSNQLREHMSNHSGERRYKCPYCPKSFHHKKLMVSHCSKRHHDG